MVEINRKPTTDKSQIFIEQPVRNNTLLIDSSMIMNQGFDILWKTIFPVLLKYNKIINVPCFEYSNILAISQDNQNFRQSIAINAINKYYSIGELCYVFCRRIR